MTSPLKRALFLPAILAALPLLASAQTKVSAPRPAATRPVANLNADPVLTRMLHESIDISQVPASQLSDLYHRFIEATRAARRQWTEQEWQDASAALSRLNARYEAVRKDLPLDDRLTVRTLQGEFRTLQGARRVKDHVDKDN